MAKQWLRSFFHGMARTIDAAGALKSPEVERILRQSDADALRSDWQAVGSDLWWGIREYELASPALPHPRHRTSPAP